MHLAEAVAAHGIFLYFTGKCDLVLEITVCQNSVEVTECFPPKKPHCCSPPRQAPVLPKTPSTAGGAGDAPGVFCMYAFCMEYLLQVNITLHLAVVCLLVKTCPSTVP